VATDVSMPRPRREMTEERRRDLGRLLGKAKLSEVEKGQLEALRRDASPAEQEQVRAKLRRAGGLTNKEAGEAIAQAAGRAWRG
jgi:hypothetical protein